MKDIIIKLSSKTSQVKLPTDIIGVNRENLQGNIIFEFEDSFINGTARLEISKEGTKSFIMAAKNGDRYIIPILSSLLNCKFIEMQLVITEAETDAGIPIYKSKMFYLKVLDSINAQTEEPEEYPEWIDEANARLADIEEAIEEVDNLNITAERITNGVNVNITDKNGNTTTTIVNDGQNGTNGQNGKSIEYNWNGTSLGIRQEGQTQYQYTNLQGEQGPAGQNRTRWFKW